jgi:putative FmdB family regulatory protein
VLYQLSYARPVVRSAAARIIHPIGAKSISAAPCLAFSPPSAYIQHPFARPKEPEMPIYEYQCDTCGAQRELFVKPGATVRPNCPTCRKRMRRVISQTAFILKGSGWYVTDYPSDARKKGLEGEKPAAPAAEAPGAKKEAGAPEKKPATAAVAKKDGKAAKKQS